MKLSPRAVPWIIAAVAVLIAGTLAVGLYRGELSLPTAGGLVRLQRASNPAGFYLLAAFQAALALAGVGLLSAVLRAPDRATASSQPPSAAIRQGPEPRSAGPGNLRITQDGRCGQVLIALDSGNHAFYWEYGGGDCIASVNVPDPTEWSTIPALAPHPRDTLLQWLAREIASQQCPDARIVIGDRWIAFHR